MCTAWRFSAAASEVSAPRGGRLYLSNGRSARLITGDNPLPLDPN